MATAASDTLAEFRARAAGRSLRLAVVGLGYVGLPLAARFAAVGFHVVGLDVDAARVRSINSGETPVRHVPIEGLGESVAAGRLRATTDLDVLGQVDAVSICVPTPLSKFREPDLTAVMDVGAALAPRLRRGQLIVLESTTYPGTTEEVLLPLLARSGLQVGVDFHLAFSPERIDPGRADFTVANTPRVIGGVTPLCTAMACALYGEAIDPLVPVSSARAAEMVKMLENSFRAVNIGLVNEVALMCDRLDIPVFEVVDAAATKPFGFLSFQPGPGLGGHCVPVDPLYLSWKMRSLDSRARFIELAEEINRGMPGHVVQKIALALNRHARPLLGSRVLVIGVAYKRDVEDVRESPAIDIIDRLRRLGAEVSYHDPFVARLALEGVELESVELAAAAIAADCAVIVTDHHGVDYERVVRSARVVVDTRNALSGLHHLGEVITL